MAKVFLRAGKILVTIIVPVIVIGIAIFIVNSYSIAETSPPQVDPLLQTEVPIDPAAIATVQQLQKTAMAHRDNQEYDQARQIYADIINSYPSTSQALFAQKNLAASYIEAGDDVAASEAIDIMTRSYYDFQGIARALSMIANLYCEKGNYGKAANYYQYAIDNWPDNPLTAKACVDLAVMSVKNGDDVTAQAAVNTLFTGFTDYDISKEFKGLAKKCIKSGNATSLAQIYRTAVAGRSGISGTMEFETAIVLFGIYLEDCEGAEIARNLLTTGFSGHPDLADTLDRIAKTYEENKNYNNAKNVYNDIAQISPSSDISGIAALNFEKANICWLVISGNLDEARQALETFMVNYHGDAALPSAIGEIMQKGLARHKLPWLKDIYQYIADNHPEDATAEKAFMQVQKINILSLLDAGTDPDIVEIMISNMIEGSTDKVMLAESLKEIAVQYGGLGDSDRASLTYNRILVQSLLTVMLLWSLTGQV